MIALRRPARGPRPVAVVLAAAIVATISYGLAAARPGDVVPPAAVTPAASLALPADAEAGDRRPLVQVDAAIAVWTANLAAEPADFIAAIHLGELYLARTRITGDAADIKRAMQAADRALDIDATLLAARLIRAQAAHAAHDFAGAEADALAVLETAPDAPEALAVLGDARLELGAYEAAAATYARLDELADGPPVVARLARQAAVTGRLDEARDLAASATDLATAGDRAPAELAWYHGLEASLAFQSGDLFDAESSWRQALELWDGSAAAHAGLGRTLAAVGRLDDARSSLERAVAIQPQPDTLRLLADILDRAGEADAAEATRVTFVSVAELLRQNRPISLFLADRGEDPERAVALAQADLAIRRDVYAHDTLAWALLAAGRAAEADVEMRAALAIGTESALLDYHAGMIAAALGRDDEARRFLSSALARNPGFDLVQADVARDTLEALDRVARP